MNRILLVGITTLCAVSITLAQAPGTTTTASAPASSEAATNAYGNNAYDAGSHPAMDAGALQSAIEAALRNDPTLSSSRIAVKVDGSTIELNGSTPSAKEKLTADRLARSFAVDRKVDNKLMVAGQTASEPATSAAKR